MRKPEIENFVWAALAWFWFAQFPFMVLIGNDWLFANLPFNWAVLLGLYSIALPFFVAGAVYLFARRRLDRLSKDRPQSWHVEGRSMLSQRPEQGHLDTGRWLVERRVRRAIWS